MNVAAWTVSIGFWQETKTLYSKCDAQHQPTLSRGLSVDQSDASLASSHKVITK